MKIIKGTIISPFGVHHHPTTTSATIHQGVDIAAVVGTPVYSPTKGIVKAIYEHGPAGRTMIISNDQGNVRYGFCHLSNFCLGVGALVSPGTMIAHSGNTGRTTGPHLHYSVKNGGQWHDEQYIGGEFVDSAPFIEFQKA